MFVRNNTMNIASLVENICNKVLSENTELLWFRENLERLKPNPLPKDLYLAFGSVHRQISKSPIDIDKPDVKQLENDFPGFSNMSWSTDQICRLAFMLAVSPEKNIELLGNLLDTGDVSEQVALFKGLFLLENAIDFTPKAVNGIRTNITNVFDAIALNNPFPATYFSEEAWNQMVLKAVFMDRPVFRIVELENRKNEKLARILQDYAHERWAAGRTVTPELWRLTSGFVEEKLFADLQRVIRDDIPLAKEAAIKVIEESSFQPTKVWLLEQGVAGSLKSWNEIGELTLKMKQ